MLRAAGTMNHSTVMIMEIVIRLFAKARSRVATKVKATFVRSTESGSIAVQASRINSTARGIEGIRTRKSIAMMLEG